MATGAQRWSKTAATNATADSNVNWAEGMAPSAVNDSARAEMASVAKWRDDISGTLTTGGTSTAYTLATNQLFTADAAGMSGAQLCFIPHATSGAAPTLAVDGLTARAINKSTGVAVPTGALIAGTPYIVTYIHATTEFILRGYTEVFGNATVTGTLGVTGVATFTAALRGADGTVSLPQYSFTNDTDCGAYRIGANNIGYAVNGAKVLDIATTGLTVTGLLTSTSKTAPTTQKLTSGSAATFTPTAGAILWRVRMVGPGAGGGGATANVGNASASDTSFQVNSTGTAWTAKKGSAGGAGTGGTGGAGGVTGTDGTTGNLVTRVAGGYGTNGNTETAGGIGGCGGNSAFGGSGRGGGGSGNGAGQVGAPNSGAGGGGGGVNGSGGGGGGGAGEYVEFWVTGMTTATYTVPAGGAGGAAGTQAGGDGAAAAIIIEEFYS